MAHLIGVDEAGYGPNLGPLVVAATLWECPLESVRDDSDLDRRVADFIKREPVGNDPNAIAIADSKQLYKPAGSLAELERGVLSCLAQVGEPPSDWRSLWRIAAPGSSSELQLSPWYREFNASLASQGSDPSLRSATELLQQRLPAAGIRLRGIQAAAVFPSRFNRLTEQHGNKASALSAISLDLVESMLPEKSEEILIHCDKHGGRKRYGPLLQPRFPDHLVIVRKEAPLESIYGWGEPRRKMTIRFVAKGDHFLPAALASMVAKYLREQAMRAFNAFWRAEVNDLQPTAGYPVDARRFKRDIAQAQQRLKIDDEDLWRNR